MVDGREHITVPFFDVAMQPLLIMHPLNKRYQMQAAMLIRLIRATPLDKGN